MIVEKKLMRGLLFMFALLSATVSEAQEQAPQDSIPFEIRKQAYIYGLARKYNDPVISRVALYNLIAIDPLSSALLDSLALNYIDYRQYASAALTAQDALKLNPDDLLATEIAAVAFENLGVKQRAVNHYEKLYLESNDLSTLYKIAFLQYEVRNMQEALTNADILVNSSKSDNIKLIFPIDQDKSQEISLKACATRLKGLIEQERGNISLAKQYLRKSLEMQPDFQLVKKHLEELEK